MIIDFLIILGIAFVELVNTLLLVQWTLPQEMADKLFEAFGHLYSFNTIIPITESLWGFSIILGFELTILIYKAIIGFLSLARGGGGPK